MHLQDLFLMAPANAEGGGAEFNWFFIIAIFAVMYFFMIRPQSRKAKEQKKFMESIEKGSKVVTIGGMHGRVLKINEDGTLLLEVDSNVKLKVERASLSADFTRKANEDK
jgi:preprotein translocase subunit YajC